MSRMAAKACASMSLTNKTSFSLISRCTGVCHRAGRAVGGRRGAAVHHTLACCPSTICSTVLELRHVQTECQRACGCRHPQEALRRRAAATCRKFTWVLNHSLKPGTMARLLAVDKKLSSDSDFEDSPPAKALGKLPRHGSGAAALRQSIEAAAERASAQPHANPDQAAVPAQPFSMFALGASSGLSQTQSHPQQRRAARWGAGSSKQAGGHKRLPAFSSSAGPHVASKKPRHAAVPPGAPPKVKQQQQVLHVNARQQQQQHKPSVRPMKHQRQPTILAPTRIDSSSNDDAVPPASLKQAVSLSRPATRKQAPALKAAQRSGKAGARPTARGGARAASRIAVAAAAAAEEAAFGSRVTLIRLDQGNDLTRWPGWQASAAGVRRVAAYRSAAYAPGSDGGTGTCAKLVRTPDVLGYELSQLGGGFQGLLINLGDGSGLTSQQLEQQQQRLDGRPAAGDGSSVKGRAVLDMLCDRLQLGRDVMSCGLLFIWAAKGQAAAAVRFMTQQGFKYVGMSCVCLIVCLSLCACVHVPLQLAASPWARRAAMMRQAVGAYEARSVLNRVP